MRARRRRSAAESVARDARLRRSQACSAPIPITPGGLGFVEAGLVGTLALAGVGAGQAGLATLYYRLIAFWLPIPLGGLAYLVFRLRFGKTDDVVRLIARC